MGFGAWTCHLRIPGTSKLDGKWGLLKVSGTIDGFPVSNFNLAPRKGEDRIISINKKIRDAIGIGLQNFPEGAAVSIPLRREGFSRTKAFLYGQASGIVEPLAGVLGAYAVIKIQPILPYALAFAAGAMIYVVVEELIPEAQREEGGSKTDVATIGAMLGFAVMMELDVALG